MSSPHSERMSRVDTAWLRMDNDVNLMMIVGVWLLSPAITLVRLRKRISDKLLRYERFLQKVVPDAIGANWVGDDDFDIAKHVVPLGLQRRRRESERQALQRLCGDLATTPLDHARPLWQFHLIEHYEGGSAIIVRIHHCIGDGVALTSVILSITDGGADPPQRHHDAAAEDPHDVDSRVDALIKAIDGYGHDVFRSLEALTHPREVILDSVDIAAGGLHVVSDLAALALMSDDSPTLLKGQPEGHKLVAWSEPIALDTVKAIGHALGCTVNDVLLACVAGAIGGSLRDRGDEPAGKEIRAMVPVNLRPLDQAWQLGNRFGLAPLVLPIGIANPVARVYSIRQRMDQLKGSYQPVLAFALLALSGLLLKPAQDVILGLFAKKTTAVMTNVPGPAQPLTICGSTLRQAMFWVPTSGQIGIGVSILSYGGGVQFGLITDRRLCPDPQAIIDRFEPEFDKLLMLTMMLPWAVASPPDEAPSVARAKRASRAL
ncbi:MAG: wax ester/triacylglycerol synthase family O-acyltransferase [Ideonella sp.]